MNNKNNSFAPSLKKVKGTQVGKLVNLAPSLSTQSKIASSVKSTQIKQSVENPVPPTMRSTPTPKLNSKDWMVKHNPYLSSLRDPLHCPGARIPDDNSSQPSTTLQVIFHGQVTTGTNGVAGVILGATGQTALNGPYMVPQLVNCTINANSTPGTSHLITSSTSATSTTPFSDSTGGGTGSTPVAIPNLASFLSSYGQYIRVVSCGLAMRTTGNYTNNQGYFIANSLPGNFFGTPIGNVSTSTLQNAPGAITSSCIGALKGVECTYTPFDNRCYQYTASNITGGTVPVNDPRFIPLNPGMLYVIALGQVSGVTFLYDIVLNYEIIVASGNLAFGVRPNLQDPLAMSTAINSREEDDLSNDDPSMFTGNEHENQMFSTGYQSKGKSMFQSIGGYLHKTTSIPGSNVSPSLTEDKTAVMHLISSPCSIKRSKAGAVQSITPSSEKPLFESVVDGLLMVAKKVAPMVLGAL